MDYELRQIEELLTDESFLKFCAGDEIEKKRWEKYLQENPELNRQAGRAMKIYTLIKAELTDTPEEVERFRSLLRQHTISDSGKDVMQPTVIEMPVQRKRWNWAVAAAVITVVVTSWYFGVFNTPGNKAGVTEDKFEHLKNDVAPGGDKAVLTLGDGSQIVLDSIQNGTLSQQGNVKVIKLNNGQLKYNTATGHPAEVLYNTLSTPKGGQYKIILSDATEVWLNAASSIRYPTSFAGKERRVEITGEAYFEVAENAAIPFKVETRGMEIEVLGTHFNVNTYEDEQAIRTTLLEGSVKLTKQDATAIMKPGQQIQFTKAGEMKMINNADLEEAIAWKNGVFQFNNASIDVVLRQLTRWYDIEVEFQGKPSALRFDGEVSRNSNLSQVLQILNYSGVNFEIEGKKLIVKS